MSKSFTAQQSIADSARMMNRQAMVDGSESYYIGYDYDLDGIRTKKSVTVDSTGTTTTHEYITQNGKIVRETMTSGTATRVFDFIYDENGRPFACKYTINGTTTTTMYYALNLQGDVVRILNANGSTMVKYAYNAWGEVISVTNANDVAITSATHIGNLNPLRYRGYYYDNETGFYYLQSRYYDPTMHRFINADSYVSTGQSFAGTNMFAYCNNNAINCVDFAGSMPIDNNELYTMMVKQDDPIRVSMDWSEVYYVTELEAATAAATITNILTHNENKEYACGIYKASNGTYFLGRFYKGTHDSVDVQRIFDEAKKKNGQLIALVHSHPYCDCHQGEFFSAGIEKVLSDSGAVELRATMDHAVSLYNNIPLYLGTPRGSLQRLMATDLFAKEHEYYGQLLPVAKIKH